MPETTLRNPIEPAFPDLVGKAVIEGRQLVKDWARAQ